MKKISTLTFTFLIIVACSPTPTSTPIPSTSTLNPPTSTIPIPPSPIPIPPTVTETPAPPSPTLIPKPQSYLLGVNDLPPGYQYLLTYIEVESGGNISYQMQFNKSTDGSSQSNFINEIEIAAHPFELLSLINDMPPNISVEIPTLGQGARAFQNDKADNRGNTSVRLVFIKGNAKVIITHIGSSKDANIEMDVKLAKIIDARLPNTLPPPSPLTFPEKLDSNTLMKYFKSVTLGTLKPGITGLSSTSTFARNEMTCVNIDTPSQSYALGFYDTHAKTYVVEILVAYHGQKTDRQCVNPSNLLPVGKYELRIAVGDVLVEILSLEVSNTLAPL